MSASSRARRPTTSSRRSSRRSARRSDAPCAEPERRPMADKTAVRTEWAPAPFQGAPYSQAIRTGGLVFVSGQLALRPGGHEVAGGGDVRETGAGGGEQRA